MSGVITGMDLLSRVYVPFDSTGNKAFGMGAAEKSAYDPMNKAALIDAPVQSLHDAPLHLFTPSLITATYLSWPDRLRRQRASRAERR